MPSHKKQSSNSSLDWWRDAKNALPSGFTEKGVFSPAQYDPKAPYAIKGKTFTLASNPGFAIEDPFDLNNLRFIDARAVRKALEELEDICEHTEKELVCLIGTGGTIASYMGDDGKIHPGLSISQLLEYAGGRLDERFGLTSFSLTTLIPSSQMEIDYIADVVVAMSWFYKHLSYSALTRFSGFVVTHGTDTLAPSATYANVMLGSNCPFSVGFVASQKTIGDRFTDVGINFFNCMSVLSELKLHRKSTVFIYMGGTQGGAFIPSASMKISDSEADAFGSPGRKKIVDSSDFMISGIDTSFINLNAEQMTTEDVFQPIILRGYVSLSTLHARIGMDIDFLYDYVSHLKTLALILVTYGAFSFSYKQIDTIMRAAREAGIMVMGVNPFPTGRTDHKYEESLYLMEQGIFSVHALEHAVYAKVKWAQAVYGNDPKKIRFFITGNNFMGEQPPEWTPPLDVRHEATVIGGFAMRAIGQPRESLKKLHA